jgi:signal transduction histidine kinase
MLGLTGALLAMASGLQILVGLKPLGELRHAVSSLRRGEINVINLAGPEEVKPLITEINTLMHDGRQAVERARARASDLAHGLKTPLTILGQIGETIAKEGRKAEAQQIADQVSTIRARVDRQLALARTGSLDQRAGLDVELALGRLVKVAGPLARSAEIALEVAIRGRHAVLADMTDFIEATGNIVDNAIRHASSQVVVTVTDLERSVRVDVSDDGPGIDEADRDRVMQRGIRLDEGGDGSGLGLAISADILRAYGGSISLAISDKGGLAVHMDWPAAADGDKKN